MLPYLLAAATAFALWLGARWLRGRRAPITLTLVLALLAVGGYVEWRYRHYQGIYTDAARALSGRDDIEVHCQRFSETFYRPDPHDGFVQYEADGSPPRRADLSWDECSRLRDWLTNGRSADAPLEQITAVHVLTHEAMHLAGEHSESVAECKAMQRDARTAQLLGAPAPVAERLAIRYWREVYPRIGGDYRSGQCEPGGILDEHPGTASWPTG